MVTILLMALHHGRAARLPPDVVYRWRREDGRGNTASSPMFCCISRMLRFSMALRDRNNRVVLPLVAHADLPRVVLLIEIHVGREQFPRAAIGFTGPGRRRSECRSGWCRPGSCCPCGIRVLCVYLNVNTGAFGRRWCLQVQLAAIHIKRTAEQRHPHIPDREKPRAVVERAERLVPTRPSRLPLGQFEV